MSTRSFRRLRNITYGPDATPVDIDIVNDRVQLRSNIVVLAFWEDYVTSVTTFAECFEDVRDVVRCASASENSALRSVAVL